MAKAGAYRRRGKMGSCEIEIEGRFSELQSLRFHSVTLKGEAAPSVPAVSANIWPNL